MKGFNFLTVGRVVFLLATFAFSVSADDGISHNLSIGGGNDLAWLKVNGYSFVSSGGNSDSELENESYFSFKYKTPLWSAVNWGGINLEWGKFGWNGAYWGFDAGFGISKGDGFEMDIGGGLSCGYPLNLPYGLRIIPGVSAGFWFSTSEKYRSVSGINAKS